MAPFKGRKILLLRWCHIIDVGTEAKELSVAALIVHYDEVVHSQCVSLRVPLVRGREWSPKTNQIFPCKRMQSLTAPACMGISAPPLVKAGCVATFIVKD